MLNASTEAPFAVEPEAAADAESPTATDGAAASAEAAASVETGKGWKLTPEGDAAILQGQYFFRKYSFPNEEGMT